MLQKNSTSGQNICIVDIFKQKLFPDDHKKGGNFLL